MSRKSIALTLVIINLFFSVSEAYLFFHLNNQIVIDFTKGPPIELPFHSIWSILPSILGLIVLIGLCWVLSIFKEKSWILAGMIAYAVCRIIGIIIFVFIGLTWITSIPILSQILFCSIYILSTFMVITVMFIKNKQIKPYYMWFGIFTVIAYVIPQIGPYLYDNFSIKWLMFNQSALFQIPTFVSLVLFIKVWLNISTTPIITPSASE
jgi:hypothetical protein